MSLIRFSRCHNILTAGIDDKVPFESWSLSLLPECVRPRGQGHASLLGKWKVVKARLRHAKTGTARNSQKLKIFNNIWHITSLLRGHTQHGDLTWSYKMPGFHWHDSLSFGGECLNTAGFAKNPLLAHNVDRGAASSSDGGSERSFSFLTSTTLSVFIASPRTQTAALAEHVRASSKTIRATEWKGLWKTQALSGWEYHVGCWMVLGIDSNRWVGWQVSDRNSFSMTRLQTGRNQGEEAATAMGPNIFSVTSNSIIPNPWSLQESFLPYEDYKLAGTKATMKNPGKLWWWESTGPLTKTPVSLALCNEGNTFKKHWFNLASHMNSTFSLLHASFTILIPCDECSHLHHR